MNPTAPQDNPLLAPWTAPHGLPPFADVRPEHFQPALHAAMAGHLAEIDAIAANPAAPDFDNTVAAFDRTGRLLSRIESLFYNLTASHTSPALQAVQREVAVPRPAGHPRSCGCWSASPWTSCAPARGCRVPRSAATRRSWRRSRS